MADMSNNGHTDQTVYEKKYIMKEDHKEYASKAVGGTALGIGIGALALTLLNRNGLGGLLGVNEGVGCNGVTCAERLADTKELHSQMFGLYKSQIDADFALYKGYRDGFDDIINKHNNDSFQLYKYSRDGFDALQSEISDLKQKVAVNEAVEPWKNKAIYDAIALEAERRCCADNAIVNYTNRTFYPVNIANVTVGTTTTPRTTYNPLCGCCGPTNGCGCNNNQNLF